MTKNEIKISNDLENRPPCVFAHLNNILSGRPPIFSVTCQLPQKSTTYCWSSPSSFLFWTCSVYKFIISKAIKTRQLIQIFGEEKRHHDFYAEISATISCQRFFCRCHLNTFWRLLLIRSIYSWFDLYIKKKKDTMQINYSWRNFKPLKRKRKWKLSPFPIVNYVCWCIGLLLVTHRSPAPVSLHII